MSRGKVLFSMQINDGYAFRNLVTIWKHETTQATMVLVPDNNEDSVIEISFMNGAKCALHKVTLNHKEFSSYIYNIRDDYDELLPSYLIPFHTADFYSVTRGLHQNDSIKIVWYEGENKLHIQLLTKANGNGGPSMGALFVIIRCFEYTQRDLRFTYREAPIKIAAKKIATICSQCINLKGVSLDISRTKNAIIFKPLSSVKISLGVEAIPIPNSNLEREKTITDNIISGCAALLQNFDFTSNTTPDNISNKKVNLQIVPSDAPELQNSVILRSSTIKALAKLHSISPRYFIYIYYQIISKR